MPDFSNPELTQCQDCGHHFQISPRGEIQGGACPDCGGKRMFRMQPNPVQSEGTLRNMVDMETGKDAGGNPDGEGILAPAGGHAILTAFIGDELECPTCHLRTGEINCPRCGTFIDPTGIASEHSGGPAELRPQIPGAPLTEGTIMNADHTDPLDTGAHGRDEYTHSSFYPDEAGSNLIGTEPANCPRCHQHSVHPESGECANCGYTIPYDGGEWYDMPGADRLLDQAYRETGDGYHWKNPEFITPHLGPVHQGRTAAEGEHQGYTNWETWHTKLMLDNEQHLYEHQKKMSEEGWTPDQIRDWTTKHVIGPENKRKIEDAQEWNEIPKEERLDPHYEEFKDKHGDDPKAMDLLHGLAGGPDVEDSTPNIIDPELVNWDEIHHNIHAEHDEEQHYEDEDQRLKGEGLTHAMPGHTDETNQMLDAWMKHHGVPDADSHKPYDNPIKLSIEHLEKGYGEHRYPDDFSEPEKEVDPHGGWNEPIRSLGWHTINRIHNGLETPYANTMQQALTGQGYPPEQIQHIMAPTHGWNEDEQRFLPLKPPEAKGPDPALDQPGKDVFPSEWSSHVLAAVVDPQSRTAGPVEQALGTEPPPEPKNNLNWTPGMKGRGIVIGGEPHTWNAFDPNKVWKSGDTGLFHPQYAESLGVRPEHVNWDTGIEIEPDGSVSAVGGHNAAPFIAADPRLKHVEENFFPFGQDMPHTARTNNMEPYESLWTREADVQFDQGPLQNTASPSPQYSVVVQPSAVGLHGAHTGRKGLLSFLDAHVNGIPVRGHGGELITKYGYHSSPDFGKPVVVAVHDPAHLPVAVESIQHPRGHSSLINELVPKIQNGEVSPPPGIDSQTLQPLPGAMPEAPVHTAGFWGDLGTAALGAGVGAGAVLLAPETGGASLAGGAALEAGLMGGGEAAAAGAADIAAPAAADAIAGDAVKPVGGLMSKAMGGAGGVAKAEGVSSLVNQGTGMAGNALGVGGGGQQGGGGGGGYSGPLQQFTHVLAAFVESDYETPASNPDVGVKHDDPEDVDQKEFNDQDKSPENPMNPNLQDSGASGEDEVRKDADKPSQGQFSPESPAIQRMEMLMPLIEKYYHSDESGANDPMLKGLHEMLDSEVPGYLNHADAESAERFMHGRGQHVHATVHEAIMPPMQQGNLQAQQQALDPSGLNPSMQPQPGAPSSQTPPGGGAQQGHCPHCGGVTQADGSCPQCGAAAAAAATPVPGGPSQVPHPQTFAHTDLLASFVDSANHQGPVTPEQIAAVQQFLIQEGRVDEVPNVPLDPGNPEYAKILAEIQNNPNSPPTVTPEEQTQPPAPQQAPPGGMPVPGMAPGEAGGQPMQPMSSFLPEAANTPLDDFMNGGTTSDDRETPCPLCTGKGCASCQFTGRRYPSQSTPHPDAIGTESKTAADNVAPRCPKCGSGTTGMVGDQDHNARCHACHNVWKVGDIVSDENYGQTSIAKTASGQCPTCGGPSVMLGQLGNRVNYRCQNCGMDHSSEYQPEQRGEFQDFEEELGQHLLPHEHHSKTALRDERQHGGQGNPVNVPAAEQEQPLNQGGDEDSSLTWKDTSGAPLQAGQQYQMVNPSFSLPDLVRVERVKPDGIDVTLLGTYTNDPGSNSLTSSTPISKEDMQLQQLSFEPANQTADDQNNEPPPGSQAPGLAQVPPSGQTTDEQAASEPQMAAHSSVDNDCPRCGHREFTSSMITPESTEHSCFRCGHDWVTEEKESSLHREGEDWVNPSAEWLNEDDNAEDFLGGRRERMLHAAVQSRSLGDIAEKDDRLRAVREHLKHEGQERQERLAGKHFTPREQRELIDEDGFARNSDMLDLEGTHYKVRDDYESKTNPERVRDADLFLGI